MATLPAGAAEFAETQDATASGRTLSLTVFSFYGPKYLGAARYGSYTLPAIGLRRPDEALPLDSPDDGLGVSLFDSPRLKAGPVFNFRLGRSTAVDPRFAGLETNPWAIEGGVFADFWLLPDHLRTRAELRHGLRNNDGSALDLSADLFDHFGAMTLSIGPRLGILDTALAQLQFGVSPLASHRSGLFAPYGAAGGLQSYGLSSTLAYDWSSTWRSTIYGRYDHLTGDAAASPITRRLGSEDQITAGVGLTYSFHSDLPFLP